jgi:hypothetical protein
VYAVWPPLVFERFEKTTHLLVTSSQLVGDTQVYPCDEHGEPMSYVMVEHVTVRNHILALCLAGYELEVLARGA